jgi:hypothetical protein
MGSNYDAKTLRLYLGVVLWISSHLNHNQIGGLYETTQEVISNGRGVICRD